MCNLPNSIAMWPKNYTGRNGPCRQISGVFCVCREVSAVDAVARRRQPATDRTHARDSPSSQGLQSSRSQT